MVRRIFVDSINEIDFNNFGVHFSENNNYRHCGGGSNGTTKKRRYEVSVFIENAEINHEATEASREDFPLEKEVVVGKNQQIKAKVVIVDNKTGYYIGSHEGEERQINTGTRCDKWAERFF